MNIAILKLSSRINGLLIVLTICCSLASAQEVEVKGRIESIGSFKVLRVWGTPQEMGYAHGYLFCKEFIALYQADLIATSRGNPSAADKGRLSLARVLDVKGDTLAELKGLFEGIRAANGGEIPQLKQLNRKLKFDDLLIYNARDAIRAFGCSGFTVWGKRAGKEGVITTRTFDFAVPGKIGIESQMILVRHRKGKHAVALITFPGYVGAFSGINELGVCAFLHDGSGGRQRRPSGLIAPMPLALTRMLEDSSPENAHGNTKTILTKLVPYPYSYMVRVVTPRVKGKVDVPSVVFRIDSSPKITQNPPNTSSCITTNHYFESTGTLPVKVGNWSLTRYKRLQKAIAQAVVTSQAAWESMISVASSSKRFPTIHALTVYPEQGRIDLALAKWKDGLQLATKSPRTTITFKKLFTLAPR